MDTSALGLVVAVAAIAVTAIYQARICPATGAERAHRRARGVLTACGLTQIWVGSKQKQLGLGSMQLMHEVRAGPAVPPLPSKRLACVAVSTLDAAMQYVPQATLMLAVLVPLMEPLGLRSAAPGARVGMPLAAPPTRASASGQVRTRGGCLRRHADGVPLDAGQQPGGGGLLSAGPGRVPVDVPRDRRCGCVSCTDQAPGLQQGRWQHLQCQQRERQAPAWELKRPCPAGSLAYNVVRTPAQPAAAASSRGAGSGACQTSACAAQVGHLKTVSTGPLHGRGTAVRASSCPAR